MTGSEFMAPDPKMADCLAVLVVRREGGGQRQRLSIADNLEADGKVRVAFEDGAKIFEADDGYAVGRGDPIARLETHSFGRAPRFYGAGDCHKGDLACYPSEAGVEDGGEDQVGNWASGRDNQADQDRTEPE